MGNAHIALRPGVPGHVPNAWIISPVGSTEAPPVVAVHGITRNIEAMVQGLAPRAQATGRTIVVPHFCETYWPRYQRASCKRRSDWGLLRLMTALRDEGRVGEGRFDLSGFSGGAQFAHRFAWLYPQLVGSLCATAPGWWTFPDPKVSWPLGIGSNGVSATGFQFSTNMRRFLDRRILVCVGSDDVARDQNLRKDPDIDAQQGTTRVERARRWCAAAEASARAVGLKPTISLRILQGCGHSFTDCVKHGRLDDAFVPRSAKMRPVPQQRCLQHPNLI